MSKQQVPAITTKYFDENSQKYFKENPGVLVGEAGKKLAEYETFTTKLIAAIVAASEENKPQARGGLVTKKTLYEREADLRAAEKVLIDRFGLLDKGLRGEILKNISVHKTQSIKDKNLAEFLCKNILSLSKDAASGLATLLQNVRQNGQPLKNITEDKSTLRENLRKILWSSQGRLAELRFRVAGYGKKGSDFYIHELRKAEREPDSNSKYTIPVSVDEKDGLTARIEGCKDAKGRKIFIVKYIKNLGKLEIEIAYSPQDKGGNTRDAVNLARKAVDGIKSGPQAAAHVQPIIKKSDLGAAHIMGAVLNAPTALLPVIPVASYAVGFLPAAAHDSPMGQLPVLGEICYLWAKGCFALAEFGSKRGNLLAGTKMLRDFSMEAEKRLDQVNKREKEIIQSYLPPIVRAVTGVVFGIGAAAFLRGTEFVCNATGDGIGYAAKYCLEAGKKPIEDPIQYGRKIGRYIGYGFLTALSAIPKAPGFIAKKCGDACSTMADRFEGEPGFGWIAGASKAMKEGADNARFFKGQGRSAAMVAHLDTTVKPDLGVETDMFFKAKDVLNQAKGLKFDQSSGIKDDENIYAILGEVEHKGQTYQVLGSSDGETITIKGGKGDNEVGGLPASLVNYRAKEGDNIAAFTAALNVQMDSRKYSEMRGVSLEEFRAAFEEKSQRVVVQNLLQNCMVDTDFKPGQKLISKKEEFKLKKSSTDEFSFEKNGSSKTVELQSTAFFNFLQEAAQGTTGLENSLSGRVGKPRSVRKAEVDPSRSKDRQIY